MLPIASTLDSASASATAPSTAAAKSLAGSFGTLGVPLRALDPTGGGGVPFIPSNGVPPEGVAPPVLPTSNRFK
jgi:hypothetical protein